VSPSLKTIKRLFAVSGNRCAIPDCKFSLINNENGTNIGEICHIKGKKPSSPRYDPNLSKKKRDEFENLLLLCSIHHTVIDNNPETYTVSRLKEIKDRHESQYSDGREPDDRIAKQFLFDVASDTISNMRVQITGWLREHYSQLSEEIYEKWFERQSSSSIVPVMKTEYHISFAKIVYSDGNIRILELEDPFHPNNRLVNEGIAHLKSYPKTWPLWNNAKKEVKQVLAYVETFWNELLQELGKKLSIHCPQLVEWHGQGPKPIDFYSQRNTFNTLWYHIVLKVFR